MKIMTPGMQAEGVSPEEIEEVYQFTKRLVKQMNEERKFYEKEIEKGNYDIRKLYEFNFKRIGTSSSRL